MTQASSFVRVEKNDQAIVTWHLSDFCNFSCSYCYPGLHSGNQTDLNPLVVQSVFQKILSLFAGQRVFFLLSGGEPLLVRNFDEVVKKISDIKSHNENLEIGVVSNGSYKSTRWDNVLETIDKVFLSLHSSSVKMNNFLENVKRVENKLVSVLVLMDPDNFFNCVKQYKLIESMKIPVQAKCLYNVDGTLYSYSDSQINVLRTLNGSSIKVNITKRKGEKSSFSISELMLSKLNSFKGFYCKAGFNNLVIDPDGSISGSECNISKKIGSIFEIEKLQLPSKAIICDQKYCGCMLDILIEKYISD